MFKGIFEDIVLPQEGFLRGPFGSTLKKSLFIPKAEDTYKVYEQSVVLQEDKTLGKYYVSKEYFENNLSRFEVKSGDFLISCSGVNYGAIYQLKGDIEKGVINQALLRVRINPNIVDENYFLYYFRAYIVKKIIGGTGDSTIPNFPPMSVVKGIEIQLPDIETQRKVGKLLAEIDDAISNNNAINERLELMARTIYDYWFLQFEFPDENGKPYKSSGGKMVWSEELKREIPEGWRVGNLSEIALITMGSSPKGESLNEDKDGITFYQGKSDFGYRFPMVRMYTNSPIRYAEVNDILLSVRAPVGDMNIAGEKCCIGRGLAAIHSRYQSFLFYLMLRNQYQFDKYNNKGTTFGAITKDELFGLRVVIPDETTIEIFDKKIAEFDKKIFTNEMQNQELISLRDFLLPLLMNGQVGFREC